jgi:alkanesulfonate monooxygenase SsuD/methylene tetrahydromethanopterin reductase-like flavin-dependent oxidoreductase (luciferase family)
VATDVDTPEQGDVGRHSRILPPPDGSGIDTVWVNDHLLQAEPGTSRDEPMLEAYTTLGFLASASRRMRLGTMVTGVTFRPVAPPLLIGGMGEKRTLRLVAEHADACNLFDIPDGGTTVRHKLRVLAGHCAAVGRPYEEIDKTISVRFDPAQPVEAFVEHCSELAELGIEHVVTLTTGAWTPAAVEAYAAAAKMLATR